MSPGLELEKRRPRMETAEEGGSDKSTNGRMRRTAISKSCEERWGMIDNEVPFSALREKSLTSFGISAEKKAFKKKVILLTHSCSLFSSQL